MPRRGDIKDTQYQNIAWTPPQGGSGPNYPNM
ncbi:TPA: 4Fe-4S dicluster domain-containing protein [Aeromonas veronii]|nr:4Fe-4S dicluster domain-containing protein [Aeromonas veronii]